MKRWAKLCLGAGWLLLVSASAFSQMQGHGAMHQHHAMHSAPDTRTLVDFPPDLRQHMLRAMRAHLEAISNIQQALAEGRFQQAAEVAESALGMSSLHDHRARDNAQYMPPAMARLGSAMHQAASQFAIAAQDASASGDYKPPLQALARLTGSCVACHAAYKLQ